MNYGDWRERLAEANDPAFVPIAWIDRELAEGRAQFWATDSGAIVTAVTEYPGGAVACRVIAGAGDLASLLNDLRPAIEAWAKAQGCTHCMIEGRDGWRRAFPDYRHFQTVLLKGLA